MFVNMMNKTTILNISSASPCWSGNETTARADDYIIEDTMQQWLEKKVFRNFRVWQLIGIVLSVLLSIVIGLCCCIRFRVPRTKQEIEADYIRKRITISFRHELSKISDTEMDQMDLQKALDRIRGEFERDLSSVALKECTNTSQRSVKHYFRSGLNALVGGMHVRLNKREHERRLNVMI